MFKVDLGSGLEGLPSGLGFLRFQLRLRFGLCLVRIRVSMGRGFRGVGFGLFGGRATDLVGVKVLRGCRAYGLFRARVRSQGLLVRCEGRLRKGFQGLRAFWFPEV